MKRRPGLHLAISFIFRILQKASQVYIAGCGPHSQNYFHFAQLTQLIPTHTTAQHSLCALYSPQLRNTNSH